MHVPQHLIMGFRSRLTTSLLLSTDKARHPSASASNPSGTSPKVEGAPAINGGGCRLTPQRDQRTEGLDGVRAHPQLDRLPAICLATGFKVAFHRV